MPRNTLRARRQERFPWGSPDLSITIPTMGWEQIDGDMDPGAHGGTIARGDGHSLELIKIQPVRDYVGNDEAKDVGFPFWTRVADFTAEDLASSSGEVKNALRSIGTNEEQLEELEPEMRAITIASALFDYGHTDEGPAGWSDDIGIPEKVKWWSGKIAGPEYIADEDEAFRNEVLGYGDIKSALEEEAERMANESSASAWSTAGDQMADDIDSAGYDPGSIVVIAEFGKEAVAVNGDLLVDQGWEGELGLSRGQLWSDVGTAALEEWLEQNGYEVVDRQGGRVPSDEGYAAADHVVEAVAKRLDVPQETVEEAAKSLDWWQEEIPWGTSGDTTVWARKKSGVGGRRPRHARRR
jgi:hypothetical protein